MNLKGAAAREIKVRWKSGTVPDPLRCTTIKTGILSPGQRMEWICGGDRLIIRAELTIYTSDREEISLYCRCRSCGGTGYIHNTKQRMLENVIVIEEGQL